MVVVHMRGTYSTYGEIVFLMNKGISQQLSRLAAVETI